MKHPRLFLLLFPLALPVLCASWVLAPPHNPHNPHNRNNPHKSFSDNIVSYTVDPKTQDLRFYREDDSGHLLGSIQHLKDWLDQKHRSLIFAMNGGMFKTDGSPVGLFIQEQITITPLDTSTGEGNFYLKPNGVLYISKDKKATICQTADFRTNDPTHSPPHSSVTSPISYATQSGPMLLLNGTIHPVFKKGSTNLNIRNGVGILPDGKLVFAMSKEPINFYDFAEYFKTMGCQNALYLDGFVSRTYLPEKDWIQTDGNFGIIIAVTMPR